MNNDQLKRIQKILIGIFIFLAVLVCICLAIVFLGSRKTAVVSDQDTKELSQEQGLSDATAFLPDAVVLYDPMPEISFIDADGKTLTLSDFTGKPLIITFWASWCPDCHEQMMIINECAALAEEHGFTYILMDKLDYDKESKQQAFDYLEENQIIPATYFDDQIQIYQQLGMHNVPTTYFIDAQGILKAVCGKQITELSVFEAYLNNTLLGSEAVTEAFVTDQMGTDGGIHTEYHPSSKEQTSQSDVLSESQGLVLEYAAFKGDHALFDTTLGYVEQNMRQNGLTAWRISGGKQDDVNALIDDFRIYRALSQADVLWGDYSSQLTDYRTQLKAYALHDGHYIDFYDFKNKQPAERFTLCYADFRAMELLAEQDVSFQTAYENALQLVENGRISDDFPLYYSWYNYKTSAYEETDLNMSEAMVTMLYLSEAGRLPQDTIKWLKDTLADGGIMARYDVKGNVVTGYRYESTATYALLAMIGENVKDPELTGKALNKMEKMRINDTKYVYNGAFGNPDGSGISSFNQLVPMVAYAYCTKEENVVQ